MINRKSTLLILLAISLGTVVCSIDAQDAKPPVLDAEARLKFYEQHQQMQQQPLLTKKWRHIGPEIMSGRITDIAVPHDRPFTFYVATASGGVWKTENEGTVWTPIFDDAPSHSVGAIAVDQNDTNVLWVGLGESNIFRSSMAGTGVYKSKDRGETWEHMGLAETQHIGRIIIHPENPNVVWVAACGREWTDNQERGVYKTTNGGITWEKVLYVNQRVGAVDLVINPSDPDILLASMWNRVRLKWSDPLPGPSDGIYKTTDGGDNWNQVTEGLPAIEKTGRIGLAVSASRPNVVYALIDNHESGRDAREGERDSYGRLRGTVIKGAEVYRSDDHGDTWSKVSESSRLMEGLYSTYGWVFGQIRVDPNDENTVFIMGVPLLKSTDGGRKFESLRYRGLHGDHHAMWINPENSNHIINGNDGGVNLSYDGGASWKNLQNLPVVQFYNIELDDAEPFNVYGSIQDNGSYMGPSNYQPGRSAFHDWKSIPGGEASIIAVDPNDQNTMYSESFYGSIMRTAMDTRTTDRIAPQAAEGEPRLRGQWLAPFILSPHNSQVVYHGMNKLFRSMNRGNDWDEISPDLTYNNPDEQGNIPYATITSISESPFKFGLLYVGTDDGKVQMTDNSGRSWTEIMDGIPQQKWVSRIVASKFKESTVYLAQNGKRDNDFQVYVYKSDDYGKTWQDISKGIPGGPVNVVTEDPHHAGVLYVGTDLGVYVSTDDGENWKVLGGDLPNAFVHDLKIHERDEVAVIGTHGRGVFKIDLKEFYKSLKDK